MNRLLFLILMMSFIACKKDAAKEDNTPDPPEVVIKQVDDAAQAFMTGYNVPGVSVAIAKNGKLVYAKSYGVADKSNGTSVTNKSLFRIASVSKPITGVAIMKLVEAGKVKLDDKVFGSGSILGTQYGTQPYSAHITDITVRQLLTHTAGGWGNSVNDPMFSNPTMNQSELISWTLNNRPLSNLPGAKYDYSNFGYCVLGRVIEKVTGKSYEDWVKQNVLAPAGISDMSISGNTLAERKTNEVVYYGQGGENPYIYNIKRMDAHGGWLATASDLARFLVSVDGLNTKPDILSPSSITTMTTGSSAFTNYGFGWSVSGPNWWHTGSIPGTGAEIVRNSVGYCFVVLCNTRSTSATFFNGLDDVVAKAINDASTKWPDKDLF